MAMGIQLLRKKKTRINKSMSYWWNSSKKLATTQMGKGRKNIHVISIIDVFASEVALEYRNEMDLRCW